MTGETTKNCRAHLSQVERMSPIWLHRNGLMAVNAGEMVAGDCRRFVWRNFKRERHGLLLSFYIGVHHRPVSVVGKWIYNPLVVRWGQTEINADGGYYGTNRVKSSMRQASY